MQKKKLFHSFIFFFCQDTTISVPPKEPDTTKNIHGSNDTERIVIISIGSTLILVLVLLILLHLYKKHLIFSTRTGALSAPGDVYETINSARVHRFKNMIDRLCLCCPSNPNNEQNVWHHLSTIIFSIFLFDELYFFYLLFDKLYLKVPLPQQLCLFWCKSY